MARIENIIINEITKGCKRLNLQPIKVKFNNDKDISFCIVDSTEAIFITIDVYRLFSYVKINNDEYMFKRIKINSISKRIKFIVYHEIGHYLEYNHHKNWYKYHSHNNYTTYTDVISYRKQNIERIADRIALYLLKKENN